MSKRTRCKEALASIRKAMMADPSKGPEAWRPRTRVIPNKKRQQSRNACRNKD